MAPGKLQPVLARASISLSILTLITGLLVEFPQVVRAANLPNRSVQLGTALPAATDTYNFSFSVPSTTNLGSIVFLFCSNSAVFADPCTPPTGLDTSSPSLVSQTGNTGFSIDGVDTTANQVVISRPIAAAAALASTYDFANIVNPSAAGNTTYVRLSTYPTGDGSGPLTDNGAVAYVTASRFQIGAFVPPFLKLCVGVTVAPDCSSMTGDRVDLGILSNTHANAGSSQIASGTNSPTGYAVYGLGGTMTSGNNIITALNSPTASFPGTGQFGINLRANLNPPVGQDPVGTGIASPTANYNIPDRFMFSNGDSLALAPQPSDYNRMTISYLVNIPTSQPVGVYSTTITYQAVAQF